MLSPMASNKGVRESGLYFSIVYLLEFSYRLEEIPTIVAFCPLKVKNENKVFLFGKFLFNSCMVFYQFALKPEIIDSFMEYMEPLSSRIIRLCT
jgi:hypothetical protein